MALPRFDQNWDGLHLEYKVEWPMGLLMRPDLINKWVGRTSGESWRGGGGGGGGGAGHNTSAHTVRFLTTA
jgi:hypothetical protein